MKAKHTPEPWEVKFYEAITVRDTNDGMVCLMGNLTRRFRGPRRKDGESMANAARIVACVNACEGINPEAIPLMLNFILRYYLFRLFAGDYDYPEFRLSDSNKDARDSLLLALGKLPTIETKGETES